MAVAQIDVPKRPPWYMEPKTKTCVAPLICVVQKNWGLVCVGFPENEPKRFQPRQRPVAIAGWFPGRRLRDVQKFRTQTSSKVAQHATLAVLGVRLSVT